MANCGLLNGEGIDTSLLFFFLLLVIIFCNCYNQQGLDQDLVLGQNMVLTLDDITFKQKYEGCLQKQAAFLYAESGHFCNPVK